MNGDADLPDPSLPRITGPGLQDGQQHTRDSVIVDSRGAVLLEHMSTATVDAGAQGTIVALDLGGKINKQDRRAHTLYLLDFDAAARLAADLAGIAARAGRGPEFLGTFRAHYEEQT